MLKNQGYTTTRTTLFIVLAIMLAVSLGCSKERPPSSDVDVKDQIDGIQKISNSRFPDPLTAQSWKLVRLGSEKVVSTRPPVTSVRFWSNGYLAGFVGCTGFAGGPRWTRDGKLLHMKEPMISQAIECGDGDAPASEMAVKFWKKMGDAAQWELGKDRLIILFADGSDAELKRVVCGDLGGSRSERECKP